MRCWCVSLLLLTCATGCAVTRDVLISTKPSDADLSIDGLSAGKAPLTETFRFSVDAERHTVTAKRFGYKDTSATVGKDDPASPMLIELRPASKHVNFTVLPVPGIVSIDGKVLSPDPVTQISADLEFAIDAQDHWLSHTVSVERPGYKKVEQKINWGDASPEYVLNLDTMRKDLSITTTPPGRRGVDQRRDSGNQPDQLHRLSVSGKARHQ